MFHLATGGSAGAANVRKRRTALTNIISACWQKGDVSERDVAEVESYSRSSYSGTTTWDDEDRLGPMKRAVIESLRRCPWNLRTRAHGELSSHDKLLN